METNSVKELKVCAKCYGDPQPIKNFCKNAMSSDGLHSWCKDCMRAEMQKRRGRKARHKDPVFVSPVVEKEKPFEAECDTGDIRGTKLWSNRHFVSGDGGYQHYIENLQPQQPLPSYTL